MQITLLAIGELVGQVDWLKQHSPAVGGRAARRILETIGLLAHFPNLGFQLAGDVREKPVGFGRDGFVIRYRRSRGTLTVLRVFHSRQAR